MTVTRKKEYNCKRVKIKRQSVEMDQNYNKECEIHWEAGL